jgi:hypothetical protein
VEHGGANVISRRWPGSPKLEKGDFNMPYKVTVWGAGQKGSLAVKEAIEHPDLELVGVLVFSDAKAGRGAAELYGGTTPSDIITTQSQECILSLDADVVIHARRREPDPTPMNDEVCAILKSGKNVISIPASSGPGLTVRTSCSARTGLPRRRRITLWNGDRSRVRRRAARGDADGTDAALRRGIHA